jgi:DNA modification methylase
MAKIVTNLILGDCESVLHNAKSSSMDLIITSPPYADSRSSSYGGIKPKKYVEWFLPKSEEFLRVLKPRGTFILNIKENATGGERSLYVLELIMKLREQGWFWTEEFIWHKKNSFPGKWPNRFRDAWERLLQFNKEKDFNMYQEAVMMPVGSWAKTRLKSLSDADKIRNPSRVGNGFGRRVANWTDRPNVYPTNVLHIATETSNREHSAVFPEALPEWFIKLFTKPGDWVLDPFSGSGTTLQVAQRMGRNSVGIEVMKKYYDLSKKNLEEGRPVIVSGKLWHALRKAAPINKPGRSKGKK